MSEIWNREAVKSQWPVRAVVTTGTPYGNKPLHFGHIGGVFVPADCFARFLRDRLGESNVRFVGGTDCFGSPINEGYRKLVEAGEFDGTIADYVEANHNKQADSLDAFHISLDIFEGSNIGESARVHQELSEAFLEALYEKGTLKLLSSKQFFDEEANTFLNGRQVVGHCPVQGCKSEKGYADECDLGHQYSPVDLINPISTISGKTPVMREVNNWYFELPDFKQYLSDYCDELDEDELVRSIVPTTIREFLGNPIVFVKCDDFEKYEQIASTLPHHEYREAVGNKQSFEIEFDSVDERDVAKELLTDANIRFRTSKTLVPFRLTGNIEWGVKAPVIEDVDGLTVWCWPESLWQPISFTIARNRKLGLDDDAWKDFWCSDDAQVYQFLGQDNLYFYGVAQSAMFEVVGDSKLFGQGESKHLNQTRLIANYHLLFGKSKASSSGSVKPPSGEELLEHYTVDQIRCHFLALGLDQKPVAFCPKPFDPKLDEEKRSDPRVADPALKEAALLNNVFNRLARSIFYEAKNTFGMNVPMCDISEDVVENAQKALLDYDACMQKVELHSAFGVSENFIRYAQKYWADGAKDLSDSDDENVRAQLLCDCTYMTWISALLMHGFAPVGCELICDYFNVEPHKFFDWDKDFVSLKELFGDVESFSLREIPPRFDFFPKHESQFKKKN